MKIITVNLPESYIKTIDKLVGESSIYPSRSELIRVAVREFLIKELDAVNSFSKLQDQITKDNPSQTQTSELFVQIPVDHDEILENNGDKVYKTYRIIKK
jgi:Arc/MetJ-type ribon-helix-helix transcriptional regulator